MHALLLWCISAKDLYTSWQPPYLQKSLGTFLAHLTAQRTGAHLFEWLLQCYRANLTGKRDLWSWFFNPLLFQLATASFHFLQSTFRTAFEAGGSNVRNDAESTGSIHRREVQRRSILPHKCPDPGDGWIQKATQAFKGTSPHLKWNFISSCQM